MQQLRQIRCAFPDVLYRSGTYPACRTVLTPKEIDRHCLPDAHGDALLRQAIARLHLSARAYHRVLKVARTIADLARVDALTASHVAKAIGYRRGIDRSG